MQLLVVMIRPYSSCCAMFVRSSMIVCCSFCLPDCIFSNVKDVQVMIATNKKGEECFEAESPDEGQFFPKVCKSIPSRGTDISPENGILQMIFLFPFGGRYVSVPCKILPEGGHIGEPLLLYLQGALVEGAQQLGWQLGCQNSCDLSDVLLV